MVAGDKVKVYVTFPENVPVDSLGKVLSPASRSLFCVEPVISKSLTYIGVRSGILGASWHFVTLKPPCSQLS